MTYAGNRRINDADSHLMELPDFLTRNADPECRKDIGGLLDRDMGFFELDAYAGQGSHAPERRAGLGTFTGISRRCIRPESRPLRGRHQVSTLGRFLWVRGGRGATERRAAVIHLRESAGSIVSSSSKIDAVLTALPFSYRPATIFS